MKKAKPLLLKIFSFIFVFLLAININSFANNLELEAKEQELNELLERLSVANSKLQETEKIINENNKTKKEEEIRSERFAKLERNLDFFLDRTALDLSDENIFYPTFKTGFTAEELNYVLAGTGLEGLGEAFKYCEDNFSLNSILFISMANHESNFGTSDLANDKNNLFGIAAYDHDPYNSAKYYSNKEECIKEFGEFFSENYLKEDGKYFAGFSPYGIQKAYATDPGWGKKVEGHMKKVGEKLLEFK